MLFSRSFTVLGLTFTFDVRYDVVGLGPIVSPAGLRVHLGPFGFGVGRA